MTLKNVSNVLLFNAIICFLSTAALAQNTICPVLEKYNVPVNVQKPHAAILGAEYQPGVDVNGNAVAAADVNGVLQAMPDIIRIPINIDLVNYIQQTLPLGTEMDTSLGMVEIHKDGRIFYNDQDITTQTQTLCGHSGVIDTSKTQADIANPVQSDSNKAVLGAGARSTPHSLTTSDDPDALYGSGN